MTRRERQKEAARRYRLMVRAVRAWLAVAHPGDLTSNIDVVNYDSYGSGETLASFHAKPNDAYCRGDRMAMPARGSRN